MSRTFFSPRYDLRFEYLRLQTFTKWPHDWLDPTILARDGLFYMKKYDHCSCAFCPGIIGKWEPGDIPREEHKRLFPRCPFITGEPVGNVPIPLEDSICRLKSQLPSYPECFVAGVYPFSEVPERNTSRYTDFATYEKRLESFSGWSKNSTLKTSDFANAGFYYCGISDHVCCFHCGGGLRDWKNGVDPSIEHARWYPSCKFMMLTKGESFINKIHNRNVGELINDGIGDERIMTISVENLMEYDIIRHVIKLGYPLEGVKDALYDYVWRTGTVFESVEDCIFHSLVAISRGRLPPRPIVAAEEVESVPPFREGTTSNDETGSASRLELEAEPPGNDSDCADSGVSSSSGSTETLVPVEGIPSSSEKEEDDITKKAWNLPECKICWENETSVLFLPCQHMVTCIGCALRLTHCPICRKPIAKSIKAYVL
uniref:Baculoviral IAP repeat-containing protein n=1 Tax=Melicertus latisulcatus pemonivirus TaxID=2984278 RepID=A0A9C7C8E4_9VIRU|nr:MAG: baculoviral IAP repeat-containing protein [Melicertus latisulcatus pemonivirus]